MMQKIVRGVLTLTTHSPSRLCEQQPRRTTERSGQRPILPAGVPLVATGVGIGTQLQRLVVRG